MIPKSKRSQAEHWISLIRKETEGVILFNSMGKDSLVLLDLLYPHFPRIVSVFMYFVQGLEHIERYIRWVQVKYPRVEMIQTPHWNLSHVYRAGMYCLPNPSQKLYKLSDVVEQMRERTGLYYTFLGMKKADGMNRRLMLNQYEEKGYQNNGLVYPLADWTQRDILAYMRQNRLPEPVRYSHNATGGVTFNKECYLWMRDNAPRDLAKMLEAFPMSERILYEHDHRAK